MNGHASNDLEFEFEKHKRFSDLVSIPPINTRAQLSVKTDYDNSFKVKAAQLFNLLPVIDVKNVTSTLECFKAELGRFLEQFPDTPPVPGYRGVNDNLLLSWRRTHSMPLT